MEQQFDEVVAFTRIRDEAAPAGRVEIDEIPGAELAMTIHQGAFADLDQAYAGLGKAVPEVAIGVDGPIREYYLVTRFDTNEVSRWRTQVGWPVFLTGRGQ